ncbi:MAG: agmatinase [Bacteroidales bacterium]
MKKYFGDFDEQYAKYENAQIVILPVPYDGTSTFVKGADKGPQAIIDASDSIEMWDIETQTEVYKKGINTATAVLENESPEMMVEAVYNRVLAFLQDGKFVVTIGGEHSVSCGSIKAYSEKYSNFSVLQIDAHADLREEYMGSKFNHACVMKRAKDWAKIIQVGIRSVSADEKDFIEKERMFYAHEILQNNKWINKAIGELTENVYLTIDLDGFDPSFLPSTGTPEPGGMNWWQVIELIENLVRKRNLVGFDIVELCPNPNEKSSDVTAAKLLYRILSMKYAL